MKIVDRTRMPVFKQQIHKPIIEQNIKPNYSDIAANIRAKRIKPSIEKVEKEVVVEVVTKEVENIVSIPEIIIHPENVVESLKSAAENIVSKRNAIKSISKIEEVKYNSFQYTSRSGEVVEVVANCHSFNQFLKRIKFKIYGINLKTDEEALNLMMKLFNEGSRLSGSIYQHRAVKRSLSVSPIVIGGDDYAFIVNPVDKMIITFELRGKLCKYNYIHHERKYKR